MLEMTKVEVFTILNKLTLIYFLEESDNNQTKLLQGGDWTFGASMLESRRDHACLYVEFERSRGVLVTGGQGARDEVRF